MPKRNVNTTRRTTKAATEAATEILTEAEAEAAKAAKAEAYAEAYEAAKAEAEAAPEAAPNVRDNSMLEAVNAALEAPTEAAPATEAAPVAAAPAKPDLKAEFIERKAAATLSVLPLYDGPSLSVHRSDKIPAAGAYLERVANPVQKAKSATSRDDSALLSYYDHLTTYRAGDYSAGFNPDSFGADLGALSRNASLFRVTLTDDKQHIQLTALGITQARNLAAKRDKR